MRALQLLMVVFISVTVSRCATKKATNGAQSGSETTGEKNITPCLATMVGNFEKEERQNPPRRIYSYSYKGNTVYYVPAVCCDFFSDLYDSSCHLIAHPDGGITGRGDGSASDFVQLRSNEKLIWKDERK